MFYKPERSEKPTGEVRTEDLQRSAGLTMKGNAEIAFQIKSPALQLERDFLFNVNNNNM